MTTYKIAILAGDGIGPEIMEEGIKVLKVIEARNDVTFDLIEAPFGAGAWFSHGSAFPEETKTLVDEADAVVKGPIGLNHEDSKQIPIQASSIISPSHIFFLSFLLPFPFSPETINMCWPRLTKVISPLYPTLMANLFLP